MKGTIVFLDNVHVGQNNVETDRSATAIEGARFGTVAIHSQDRDYDRPVMRHWYWAIDGWANYRYWEGDVGKECSYSTTRHRWETSRGDYLIPVRCISERAFRMTEEPIPPPARVRSELRWHRGRWEKHLKSKGWVAA